MKLSLKKNVPDSLIEERLSRYVGRVPAVSDRLAMVAKPARIDPRISLRLRRYTR